MKHTKTRKIFACLCSFVLALQLMPAVAFAQLRADDEASASIEQLLAAGEYVEGEAIAIVRAGADVGVAGTAEAITEVSADSVELAAEGMQGAEGELDDEMQLRVQSVQADSYDIRHVVDHSRTTEQILTDLYANPDVVAAEPNYLVEGPSVLDADATSSADGASGLYAGTTGALTPQAAGTNSQDLTSEQWSLDSRLSEYAYSPLAPSGTYSMNVPGWYENRTSTTAEPNASGTVCIMDTGLDTTHPDLQGVLYSLKDNLPADRYAALQKEYGCGEYGLNASGFGDTADVTAYDSHGVHVSGIVAAQWNDFGVSGVANGAKIFGVRIFGDDGGHQEEVAVLKGFKFLIEVAQDVNLKAVNCSWGNGIPQFGYEVLINELGKKGVNTIIASGNRFCDLDETTDIGAASNSPYSITVDATAANGKKTDFTCWGRAATDVFAPGAQIMSTISQEIVLSESDGEVSGRRIYQRLFPEATDAANLLVYEKFDGDTSGVRFFTTNPATDPNARELSFTQGELGYGDTSSAAVNVAFLNKEGLAPMVFRSTNGYVYLAIPVDSPSAAKAAKWVSMNCAMSDSFKPAGGIAAITCAKKDDGSAVEVNTVPATALMYGWNSAAFYNMYYCQWSAYSFNIDEMIKASNEAHDMIARGEELPGASEAGKLQDYYTDPGEVEGVYGWEKDGKTYLIAKVGLGTRSPESPEPTNNTKLYIDNVAVGDSNAFVGAYEIMSGTSMATPAVSGCIAVIAKDEPESATLSDEQLELEARERAAKLLASVEYDDANLGTLCRTGGRVNLAENPGFTKKAPLITRATSEADTLSVAGSFFGTSGALAIDDVDVPASAITSWADDAITVSLGSLGLKNGSHVVKVTNGDGALMRMTFSYSNETAKGLPLYERTHSVFVGDEQFAADLADRVCGSAAYCDGSVYVTTAMGNFNTVQSLWRYDVEADAWSPCTLPAGVLGGESRSMRPETVHDDMLVTYKGELYLWATDASSHFTQSLWRYDSAGDSWTKLELADGKGWPSGRLCCVNDNLILVGVSKSTLKPHDDGATSTMLESQEAGESTVFVCGLVDLDARTVTEIDGAFGDEYGDLSFTDVKLTTSGDKIYLYFAQEGVRNDGFLLRLTYDQAANKMTYENLKSALHKAIGNNLVPTFNTYDNSQTEGWYFALAGLPDGVAIVGSSTLGEDTHIIRNDSTDVETYGRTSSYHKAFEPTAVYGDDYLYVIGENDTEPDVMYFRSTRMTAPEPEPDPTPEPEVKTVPMFRLYNPNSGEHFYTASASERDQVVAAGWNDEGIGWYAPENGKGEPVYRLYNANGGEHHYTLSTDERDGLVAVGWTDEGIGWYSDPARTVEVLREYNPNAFANNHNYTPSKDEHDGLVALGWRDEGIGWYAVAAGR